MFFSLREIWLQAEAFEKTLTDWCLLTVFSTGMNDDLCKCPFCMDENPDFSAFLY
jgi:hypothetical protein